MFVKQQHLVHYLGCSLSPETLLIPGRVASAPWGHQEGQFTSSWAIQEDVVLNYVFQFLNCAWMCACVSCVCVCLAVDGKKGSAKITNVYGSQRTTCRSWLSPSILVNARDQTPVSRHGTKCLPTKPSYQPWVFCLFLRVDEDTGKQNGEREQFLTVTSYGVWDKLIVFLVCLFGFVWPLSESKAWAYHANTLPLNYKSKP